MVTYVQLYSYEPSSSYPTDSIRCEFPTSHRYERNTSEPVSLHLSLPTSSETQPYGQRAAAIGATSIGQTAPSRAGLSRIRGQRKRAHYQSLVSCLYFTYNCTSLLETATDSRNSVQAIGNILGLAKCSFTVNAFVHITHKSVLYSAFILNTNVCIVQFGNAKITRNLPFSK